MGKVHLSKALFPLIFLLFISPTLTKGRETRLSLDYGRLFLDEEVGLKSSGCLTGELSHRVVYNLEMEGIISYSNSKVRYKPTTFKNVNSWSLIEGVGYSWHYFKPFISTVSLGAGRLFFEKDGLFTSLREYWVYQAKVGIKYQIKERLSLLVSYSRLLFRDEYCGESQARGSGGRQTQG